MNRQVFKDKQLQSEFQEKGFVKMPLLSQVEVASIFEFIKTLQPDDGFKPTEEQISRKSTYHTSFLDTSVSYKRQLHNYLSAFFKPYTDKVLCDFDILSINFHLKQPGYGELPIHQNWTTAPIEDTTVTAWCPLVDVSEINGGIHLVEGSHKIVPDIASLHAPAFFRPFEKELIQNYLKPVPMSAGELLVFDDSLIHWSPQNNSDKPRIAIQIIMVPKDVTPRYYHFDRKTNTFESFAINSKFLITHTAKDLIERPQGLHSLGFSKSVNREISLEEFKLKMKQGAKTRQRIYNSRKVQSESENKKPFNLLSYIGNKIKRLATYSN